MKIENTASVVADNEVVVTYTVEAGDPQSFFFEIFIDNNNNSWRQDYNSRKVYSGSGSFTFQPGYIGTHCIEAYDPSAIVGKTTPFSTGPTFNVLTPGSTSTNSPNTTQPPVTSPHSVNPTTSQPGQIPSLQSTQGASSTARLEDSGSGAAVSPFNSSNPPTTQTVVESVSVHGPGTTATKGGGPGSVLAIAASTTTERDSGGGNGGGATGIPAAAGQSRSHSQANTRAIIGGAVGGFVALAILFFILLRCRRRRQRQRGPQFDLLSPTVAPFLGFAVPASASSNEKQWRMMGFTKLNDSSAPPSPIGPPHAHESHMRTPSAPSFSTTLSRISTSSTLSRSTESAVTFAPMLSPAPLATQMEWVLRPTNDPPPTYSTTH
ncbi:hypothetical protein C8F01DRAFT_770539 [Mycena amicta]|nr:hypothetical protein C8F01DRAFT_770539 [Mycena amicta]